PRRTLLCRSDRRKSDGRLGLASTPRRTRRIRTAGVDRRHQSSARLRLRLLCTDALPTKWVLGLFRMQLMGRHMSLNNLLDLRGAILEYSIKPSDARCGIRAAHRFTLSSTLSGSLSSFSRRDVGLAAVRWPTSRIYGKLRRATCRRPPKICF